MENNYCSQLLLLLFPFRSGLEAWARELFGEEVRLGVSFFGLEMKGKELKKKGVFGFVCDGGRGW